MSNEVEIIVTSDDRTGGGFNSAQKKAGGLGDKLKSVGKAGGVALAAGVVAGTALVVKGIDDSIEAASNLGESLNAVDKIFGDQADVIKKWGEKNAASFGLSQRAFNDLAVPLGAGLKNAGFSLQDTTKWTVDLTKRASDMASVFNTDVSTAMEAIQAGLRGEADPLEQFGVGLSDARVKARALADTGKSNVKELSNQEIQTARLNEIMDQTNDTAGDFLQTSDGVANQERITAAEVENLQAKIGEKMLPMVQKWNEAKLKLVGTLSDKLLPAMDNVLPKVEAFGSAIGDKLAPKVNELKDAFMGKFSEGLKKIKDAFADNKPEIEWLAEHLEDLAKRVWPMVVEAVKFYATYVTTAIEVVIRSIGAMVDAYLVSKESISGALAGALESFKAFGNGVFDIVESVIQGSLLKLAESMDAVFGTHTADAVKSALGTMERYRTEMNSKLDNMIGTLHRYQAEAQSDRNEIKIKENLRTHQDRVKALTDELKNPALTKERRIRIKADLSKEQQAVRNLQKQIDRMHGKTIYINVREVLGYGARKLGRQDYAHGGIVGAQGGGPRSGLTMVGEHGRELVRLAPGSQVHSNPDTERMLGGGGGSGGAWTVNLNVAGKDFGAAMLTPLLNLLQTNGALRAEIRRAAG